MSLMMGCEVDGQWRAGWTWSAERGGTGLTVRRFRRSFALSAAPGEFVVHVSADSRYRLYVNGRRAGRGPLKGVPERYYYESYDIAGLLREGRNVIAAEVSWFGLNAPNSEVHTGYAGFLLQGPEGAGIDTPGGWKVEVDRAVTPDRTSYIANAQSFLDHTEHVDGRLYPRGWEGTDYDDSDWGQAVHVCDADVRRSLGETHQVWELVPRDVPMLVEEPRRFARTVRDMRPAEHVFGDPPRGWRLAPGEAGEIVLDAGVLTTGYPELRFQGGAGRTVEIIYGECIGRWKERPGRGRWRDKAIRDDLSWGDVDGYRDTVILPGGAFEYEPLHWRTFWFVRLAVSAGDEPFELRDFTYRFTTYAQQLRARYESSDPDSAKMMEVSWRTLQLCSHETYEDCPYYEQLNYIFDARNEALCSLAMAGDASLPRRTIQLFRDSMRPDGLIHARVPSRRRLRLPYFALFWIVMLGDYWRWTGDRAFVRECLFAVEGILWWFRKYLREDDFLGELPYWNPTVRYTTNLTCMYLFAMEEAIRLHTEAGYEADADRWRPWAERIRAAVREHAWDEERGLFLGDPGETDGQLDQNCQVYAVLSGAATEEQTRRVLDQLTSYPFRSTMTRPGTYYLARVLECHGRYAEFDSYVLKDYRMMLGRHLTTWLEGGEPGRSDCHAWTSWIAADFLTAVLGIKPLKPGFDEVLIRPQIIYEHARGSMPTVGGTVSVDWRRDGDKVILEAEVPAGVPVTVELPGAEPQHFPQGGRVSATAQVVA